MKTTLFSTLVLLVFAGSIYADCVPLKGKIKIDGILNEPAWSKAPKETGFIPFTKKNIKPIQDQTSFSILYDQDSVYFGITCHERDMKKILEMPAAGLWSNESVELFLSPTGNPMNFYQFLIIGVRNRPP